jgi:TetR/AcrR family transcriptional regulator, transcriptional repressor for nem operon
MRLRPDSTRERLIDVAMELFHSQGYLATGVAQILKQAQVNSGSLYYFFPTKEDLLLAVLERYKVGLWPMLLEPIWSRIDDPIEKIFGLLDGYRRMLMATDCSYGCPIGNLALEVGHSHAKARQLLADNFQGWRDAVRGCLDDAGDRLPADLDRAQLASFVLTVMEGAVMQARTERSLKPFDDAVTQLRDYFERITADGTEWGARRDLTTDNTGKGRPGTSGGGGMNADQI